MAIQSMFVASHSSLLTSRLVSLLASRLSLLLMFNDDLTINRSVASAVAVAVIGGGGV